MIELLFFFTACILTPMYEDYYCQINIFLIPSLNELQHIWYQETGNVTRSDTLRGIYTWMPKYDTHVIWILEGHDGEYSDQGCTVLWHELLHVKGHTNKDMPYCNWRNPNVNSTD